ncbi:hypothetical protein BC832DRAFT_617646 [Gaertneriomyces semiglobifer]|nr:hypothetical protein BC832DRAFT_617646 [Gaertneriomyces semiglobifer]
MGKRKKVSLDLNAGKRRHVLQLGRAMSTAVLSRHGHELQPSSSALKTTANASETGWAGLTGYSTSGSDEDGIAITAAEKKAQENVALDAAVDNFLHDLNAAETGPSSENPSSSSASTGSTPEAMERVPRTLSVCTLPQVLNIPLMKPPALSKLRQRSQTVLSKIDNLLALPDMNAVNVSQLVDCRQELGIRASDWGKGALHTGYYAEVIKHWEHQLAQIECAVPMPGWSMEWVPEMDAYSFVHLKTRETFSSYPPSASEGSCPRPPSHSPPPQPPPPLPDKSKGLEANAASDPKTVSSVGVGKKRKTANSSGNAGTNKKVVRTTLLLVAIHAVAFFLTRSVDLANEQVESCRRRALK